MEDLFHGHVFCIQQRWCPDGHDQPELGALFHAKEYPSDLATRGGDDTAGGGAGFSTHDSAYRSRNLVWLSHTNTVYVWSPPLGTEWEGLLQLGTEWAAMEPELKAALKADYDGMAPHRRGYTLSEAGFRELAEHPADAGAGGGGGDAGAGGAGAGADDDGGGAGGGGGGWDCDVNLMGGAVVFAWSRAPSDHPRL